MSVTAENSQSRQAARCAPLISPIITSDAARLLPLARGSGRGPEKCCLFLLRQRRLEVQATVLQYAERHRDHAPG